MKRALLIAGGTVGSLGAVLTITPPPFTSSSTDLAIGGNTIPAAPAASNNSATSAAPAATTAASNNNSAAAATKAPAATKTTAATKAANSTATQKPAASATPTAAATTAAATPSATKTATTKNVSGTFTGDSINVGYGNVQVQITVVNGKITDAQALSAPTGRNDRWTQMSVPVLREKTLAAQGSNITGVSGASYTSYGWWKSLVSALSKAGL